MNNGTPVYTLQKVARSYNGRTVIDIPQLDIHRGEVLALVGPSGAGKSTLLRLLNFLELPTRGRILFDGISFSAEPGEAEMPLALRRKVTTVFQRPMLMDDSVWNNVSYGLRLRGERQIQERVDDALQAVGLEKFSHQRARTLSGGEAQRVALARALVLQPDVLLMDEPTANLDPYNIGLIEQIALDQNREHGTTLVLVTHNVFQAHRMAQRVAFLLEGKLVEVADTETFFTTPLDPRTAAFTRGEMVY